MLKFLLFAALVLFILYAFSLISRRRPPGDWDRDEDPKGPVQPTGRIGTDDGKKPPAGPKAPDRTPEDAGAGPGEGPPGAGRP
ncbi:hypothetical protein [Hyphomonas sp.]|uniref:hypothetical protein n=1 Tax=Hyphomonas sp. TaxID=87 RepID=UPI00391C074B